MNSSPSMGSEHRSDAFKAKNPDATVPLLELDDGTCIAQRNAITEYIDSVFDGPSLMGATPKERARIAMMSLRAENGLMSPVGTYFHHVTPGLGPDLETWQCAEWGNRQKEVARATIAYLEDPAVFDVAMQLLSARCQEVLGEDNVCLNP
ncbi:MULTISPECIES: glutathione S-transferase family protein [Pseudomonadaceae]|uniref:glutathione S-transferase family protein n=1 Tax=Pseudomonadaceae TaxID=135621 RepID=UPI00191C56BE|nr:MULTISPECIES: glutathione S-transferase family protein [Pseudomonadaceae]UVO16386.1 glutathione S-transferase family protein [Stutzerimonas stutzeri]